MKRSDQAGRAKNQRALNKNTELKAVIEPHGDENRRSDRVTCHMVLKRSDRASRAKNQRELNKNTERRERSKVDESKSSEPEEE